jgi:hypothetical protein
MYSLLALETCDFQIFIGDLKDFNPYSKSRKAREICI